jgi:ATP-dependent RNA helicase MSS116
MFNACRRGPASISRIFRAGSNSLRIQSTRPSTLSLISKSTTKPTIESRWLHVSSQLRQFAASQEQAAGESEQEPVQKLTTFQELIDNNLVHPNVVNEIIKSMGHHTMTQVQAMTIKEGLNGDDM